MKFVAGLLVLLLANCDDASVVDVLPESWDSLAHSKTAVLLIYAPWCRFCVEYAPEFEKAAARFANDSVLFARIDGSRHGAFRERFSVRGYPTTLLVVDGHVTSQLSSRSAPALVAEINSHLDQVVKLTKESEVLGFFDFHEVSLNVLAPFLNALGHFGFAISEVTSRSTRNDSSNLFASVLINCGPDASNATHTVFRTAAQIHPSLLSAEIRDESIARFALGHLSELFHREKEFNSNLVSALKVLEQLENEVSFILIVKPWDERVVYLPLLANTTEEQMSEFMDRNKHELVSDVIKADLGALVDDGKGLMILFRDHDSEDGKLAESVMRKEAMEWKGEIWGVVANGDSGSGRRLARSMGIWSPGDSPMFCIAMPNNAAHNSTGLASRLPALIQQSRIHPHKMLRFVPSESFDVLVANNGQALSQWTNNFRTGNLKPSFKSEIETPQPAGNVLTLIGNSIEKVFSDFPDSEFLVLFLATWCGHCKVLAPELRKLADEFEKFADPDLASPPHFNHKPIVAAQLEISQNEVPWMVFDYVPTIVLFFKKNETGDSLGRKFVAYDPTGERTMESLLGWVKQVSDQSLVSKQDPEVNDEL